MSTEIRFEGGAAAGVAGGLVGQARRLQLANRQAGILDRDAERRRQALATAGAQADVLTVRQRREGGVLEPRSPVARRRPVVVAAQAGLLTVDVYMQDNYGPYTTTYPVIGSGFTNDYSVRLYSTQQYPLGLLPSNLLGLPALPYEDIASPGWDLQSDVIPQRAYATGLLTLAPRKSARCGGDVIGRTQLVVWPALFLDNTFLSPVSQRGFASVFVQSKRAAYLRIRVNVKANASRFFGNVVIDPVQSPSAAVNLWHTTPLLESNQPGGLQPPAIALQVNRIGGVKPFARYLPPAFENTPCAPARPGTFQVSETWTPEPEFTDVTVVETLSETGYLILTLQISEGSHLISLEASVTDWYMPENEISMQWAIAPSLSTLPTLQ